VVRSYRGKGKTKDHTEEVVSLSGKRVADRGGGCSWVMKWKR